MVRAMVTAVGLVMAASIVSCGTVPASRGSRAAVRDDHTISTTPVTGPVDGRPTVSMPIPIPGQSTCVIPFGIETTKGWLQDADPFSRGGMPAKLDYRDASSSPWMPGAWGGAVRWHNAIIRDMTSGSEWMVLDRRGVISQWWTLGPRPKGDETFRSAAMVFIATTADSNGDGLLNDLDANAAIIAEADGTNPRVATPAHAQVWSTAFDQEKGLIYLFVVTDTTGDGKFGTDDAGGPYVVSTAAVGPATPLLTDGIRGKVESLLR